MAEKQTICLCRLMHECAMLDLEKSGVKPDITQSKHKCKLCGVYISGICLKIYYEGRENQEILCRNCPADETCKFESFFSSSIYASFISYTSVTTSISNSPMKNTPSRNVNHIEDCQRKIQGTVGSDSDSSDKKQQPTSSMMITCSGCKDKFPSKQLGASARSQLCAECMQSLVKLNASNIGEEKMSPPDHADGNNIGGANKSPDSGGFGKVNTDAGNSLNDSDGKKKVNGVATSLHSTDDEEDNELPIHNASDIKNRGFYSVKQYQGPLDKFALGNLSVSLSFF